MISTKILPVILVTVISLFVITSCDIKKGKKEKKSEFINTDTYNFADPKILELPQAVDEISGIAYYPKDTSVFAIIDEDGLFFKIPLKNPKAMKEWRFDKRRDFEDLVLKDSVFYVLISNGDLDLLRFKDDRINVEKLEFPNASKKMNEFESLYYDTASKKMILMCKECEEDNKNIISSFAINDTTKEYAVFSVMETDPIFVKSGLNKERIKASATAINPVTGELFILCSVNKLMIILDAQGKVKDAIKLNPKMYKQPEGMAFTPEGDLIISNEFHEEGSATLLLLKNKKR